MGVAKLYSLLYMSVLLFLLKDNNVKSERSFPLMMMIIEY